MSGNFWIKLYIEILDDSKMAILPDRSWRRIIELFMLAGRYGKGGALPDTTQLAWVLRMPIEDLDLDLRQIEHTGIIQRTASGWLIPKFAERQAKMTSAERMKLYRQRLHQDQYYGAYSSETVTDCVTLSNTSVTQITDNRLTDNRLTDIDNTQTSSSSGQNNNIFSLYSENIAPLTQITSEKLKSAVDDYGDRLVAEAINIAVVNNHRNWGYIQGVLRNKKSGVRKDDRTSEAARSKYGEWET
jgi:DnaD/phage-associated family protein